MSHSTILALVFMADCKSGIIMVQILISNIVITADLRNNKHKKSFMVYVLMMVMVSGSKLFTFFLENMIRNNMKGFRIN